MKIVLKDFLKFLINFLLVIILIISSFIIVINLFHYKEMNYKYILSGNSLKLKNDFKDRVDFIDNKFSEIDINLINDKTKIDIFQNINSNIDDCLNSLKNSYLYNMNENYYVDYNSVYEINDNLRKNISNKCMFIMNYNISSILDTNHINDIDFNSYYKLSSDKKIKIDFMSEYIDKKLLANTNYSFSTDTSRNTVYNDLESTYILIVDNYNAVAENVEVLINWYLNYYGGNI